MIITRWVTLITIGVGLIAGCGSSPVATSGGSGEVPSDRSSPRASAVSADDEPTVAAAAVKRYRSVRSHQTTAAPVRVHLPSIDVTSELQRLGRNADGTIEVPDDWQQAGWYHGGPKPGQGGPAVILGHVDSKTGPAVFYRLRELDPGDEVRIDRADGTTATFVVERSERHAKTRFPTHEVYLPTLRPTLRLVTCGGPFDSAVGHYRDNVVVFATLVE